MRLKRDIIHSLILTVTFIVVVSVLNGCTQLDTTLRVLKGELIGNNYVIGQWDDFGNEVFTIVGKRVALSGQNDTVGEETSYLDITIDGNEWQHVGGTLVFAQAGVDVITDFSSDDFEGGNNQTSGLIGFDRCINKYQNMFGKELVVLISTQNGTPLMLLQGDDCYTEVPSNLPKTTLVNIDGKLVYVHRANIDIMDANMFKGD